MWWTLGLNVVWLVIKEWFNRKKPEPKVLDDVKETKKVDTDITKLSDDAVDDKLRRDWTRG